MHNVYNCMQQENASAATQKVKEGVSSFLGGISKALVIAPDDDYQLAHIVGGQAVVYDRYKVCVTIFILSLLMYYSVQLNCYRCLISTAGKHVFLSDFQSLIFDCI